MIAFEQAREQILNRCQLLGNEHLPLGAALGRVITKNLTSPCNMPRFNNSAVDGYGIHLSDLENPVGLQQTASIQAGDTVEGQSIGPGQCARVFTGSPVPNGVAAVVMQEDATVSENGLVSLPNCPPGKHIRFEGEEIQSGAQLPISGQIITPGLFGFLMGLGISEVPVAQLPNIALVTTGNELANPGETLKPGQIIESNSSMLSAAIKSLGLKPPIVFKAKDGLEETSKAIREALEQADVVITSGGVSVGDHDYVRASLEHIGAEIEFWRVNMRPGKPFAFATFGSKLIFCLPGNPVSALVGFQLFVRPALLKLQGYVQPIHYLSASLAAPYTKPKGRTEFARGHIELAENLVVTASLAQDSHMLSGMLGANCLIEIPSDVEQLAAGSTVKVIWLQSGAY